MNCPDPESIIRQKDSEIFNLKREIADLKAQIKLMHLENAIGYTKSVTDEFKRILYEKEDTE